MLSPETGIYIHWPFCSKKCPYCDFNTYVRQSIDEEIWLSSYLKALDFYAAKLPDRKISTIFFGGGTPSLMKPDSVGKLIARIQKNWQVSNDLEITLEANPTTVEIDKFEGFRSQGVNRVSIGVQSFNDQDLKFLGRGHDATEAIRAVETAQSVFERSSFDLIYARPDQTLSDWEAELDQAIDLAAGHLSLYQLTIEPATPFYKLHKRGDFKLPEEELAADFYALTQEKLSAAGLNMYEVSNHAVKGQESQHNLIYWHYDNYIGIGPGAHGRIDLGAGRAATYDHKSPEAWLDGVEGTGHGLETNAALSPADQFTEGVMMGMRLAEGLDLKALETKTGAERFDVLDEGRLTQAITEGWITYKDDHISATAEGLLRLNGLLRFIIKAV